MPKKVEISHKTIIFTVIFLLLIWLVFQLREFFLILFISLILMSVLNPSVRKLENLKLPRWLAILIIYIIFIAVIVLAISGIVPPLIEQTGNLVSKIPGYFKDFNFFGIDDKVLTAQLSQFTALPTNIFKLVVGIFSNIATVFGLAILTFYLLIERKNLDHYLAALFGEDKEKSIDESVDEIESRLGGWVRGQLILMATTAILAYIGFTIIGLEFALPLAILAFLFEIIPSFGSTVAAIPAVIIGLTISPIHGIAVVGWVFLIQQLQHSVFIPRIMKSVAGVNPLISILSLMIGLQLAGVGGALLAIPTYIVLEVVITKLTSKKSRPETPGQIVK